MEIVRKYALNYITNPYVILVIVYRIAGYVFMMYRPLEGMIISFIFDMLDWWTFSFGKLPVEIYEDYDKPLDYIQYIFLIPLLYSTPIFLPYMLFLIWRTLGHLVYHKTLNRKFFILFPNIAEYIAFIYFLDLQVPLDLYPLSPLPFAGILLFKLFQEIGLHYSPKNITYHWGQSVRRIFLDK